MSKKPQLIFLLIATFSVILLTAATVETQDLGSPQTAPANSDSAKTPQGFKAGSIKGRVVGEDGKPMANVPVTAAPIGRGAARRPGLSGQGAQTNSDDDGLFEFEGLAPASYAISASAPGFITPPIADENGPSVYRAGDVANITLVRGGVITGKVLNASGSPLTGVSVNAIRVGGLEGEDDDQVVFQSFGRAWRTDDRGVYRIYGLVPGSYIIQAGQTGQGQQGQPGQFGGPPGARLNFLSPFSEDAPTYYPSSARDAATPVSVRIGEEVVGIDISYRGEKGRVVSGRIVTKTGDEGFGPTQVALIVAGSDAVVATATQMDGGRRFMGRMNRGERAGFAIYGVRDGDYEIVARRAGFGSESDAVSAPRRVSVHGADVGGVELTITPLQSISGRVVVEKKAGLCKKTRASSIEEILLTAERDGAPVNEPAALSQLAGPVAPNAIGEFLIRNLQTGRHRVIAQLPDENWYVRAISLEGKPTLPSARKTPTRVIINVARDGVTLKPGEKPAGMTVTIADGAAAVKGKVVAEQDGKLPGKVRAYMIPAEKEAAEDTLRYAQANAGPDGDFNIKNLAPGRYYLLAKMVKDSAGAKTSSQHKAWDAAARAILRREAEAAGNVLELQNCQRVEDYKLRIQSK
ncbi:MAG: carboxypeptidase regulatory-like domain-containing protein [Chloracidobacterium sp.]|nr:carboxypeptidase regulatory-like domain-containing protein [Chloracidobacterium sp.]